MRTLVAFLIALTPALAHADKTYNEGKGGSFDCKTDPSIAINANNGTYTFKGACKSIAINGNNNKVTTESGGQLDVNGNNNTVTTGTADAISTNGNGNKVTYKTGTPTTSNLGNHNTITGPDKKAK